MSFTGSFTLLDAWLGPVQPLLLSTQPKFDVDRPVINDDTIAGEGEQMGPAKV